MEYLIGIALALGTGIFATLSRFDRERSFYPLTLVVIASYYVLFGVLGGSPPILAAEVGCMVLFAAMAVVGFRTNLWIVAGFLFGHGAFDIVHGYIIADPGVPVWWPGFCSSFDIFFAGYLAWRLSPFTLTRRISSEAPSSFAALIRPFVALELRAAIISAKGGDPTMSFSHLERAHVLAQRSTILHVWVHVQMLQWAARRHDWQEGLGQVLRIVGASITTPLGFISAGNTGGSNVPLLKPVPIPPDLARLIAQASIDQ